ncbi:hypothetical protein [Nonomuraea sp. NPDC049695]|uniref:hypothetical protein n=1 Tax=Nonomuraea sp. NPDC049695 TaxID=3154734 RepID=UPI0034456512
MRVPALLLVLLTAACAGPPAPVQNFASTSEVSPTGGIKLSGGGEFSPTDTSAIVYDSKLVPKGAQASATVESSGSTTRTSLVVEGLLPDHRYGAHLHTKPCGAKPDDSGPHFQHHRGEVSPSSEVWLDVATNGDGAGRSTARNDWALDPRDLPGSLVLHSKATKTSGPGVGTAGVRVACLTLKKAS